MLVSPDATPVEVLYVSCFFRVAILVRLECSRASRLVVSRAPTPAKVGQGRPGSGCLRYAAIGRLDLLDSSLVALISGYLVAGVLVSGVLASGSFRD
jgi:hypothetical protein